jgi:RNA polymerase sigma-70 factor (ECF subfamily)
MDADQAEQLVTVHRSPGDPEDVALLQRFVVQGDRQALGLLFTRHADAAYRFALRLAARSADAEDAVQTAFLEVFHHANAFKGESAVKSWILGFVMNACRRQARSEGRLKARHDRAAERAETVIGPAAGDSESRGRVQQAVQDLPEHYRAPIWLHYAEGLSPAEVAAALQLPENTVRKQLARGIDRLRLELAPFGATLSLAAILPTLAAETAPSTLAASLAGIVAGPLPAAAVHAGVAAKVTAFGAAALLIAGTATMVWWGDHPRDVRPPEFAEIDRRVLEWQPAPKERLFDRIGWVPDLRTARRLSRESGRPLLLLTQSGRVNLGRTDGGSYALRATALADARVIELLNGHFVPVYVSNVDYGDRGSAPAEEKAEQRRIYAEARDAGMPVGMDWIFLADPGGRVLATLELPKATPDRFAAWLDAKRCTPRGEPLVRPSPQSHPPAAKPDDLVLHVTARYLDARGEVEQRRTNFHELPAEDWIVLGAAEEKALRSSGDVDPALARRLFAAFHPLDMSVGPGPDERNRYERTALRVTRLSRSYARLDGELRMERSFNQLDNRVDQPIVTSVKGYLEFDADRGTIRSLRMVTEDARYGRDRFGVALRSVQPEVK